MEDTGEAHISAPPEAPCPSTRIPSTDGDQKRTQNSQPTTSERSLGDHSRGLQKVGQAPKAGPGGSLATGPPRRDPLSEDPVVSHRWEGFPPSSRLRKRAEFLRAQRQGRRAHTPHLVAVVFARPEGGKSRLGITVTKKVSAKAVVRNRIKRVSRELFRKNAELFPRGCDIVLIAKREAIGLDYEDLLREVRKIQSAMSAAARRSRTQRGPQRGRSPKAPGRKR